MARRVRFLTLTLAGFGRYDRPTRFDLGAQSRTFTSPNELGKSTFVEGLIGTLFGPPGVRTRLAEFQRRNRSWSKPDCFWGELDFSVADEHWRVRHDFEKLELKVWRIPPAGIAELHHEAHLKPGRKGTEPEPYDRLLEDWIGLADRSLFEAMFTLSQQSTLATAWQIDPRVSSRVYGPAVERLAGTLESLYGRFRDITRNTRDFQIAIGPQGERNGRSDGRLDEIVARIAELESSLAGVEQRAGTIDESRASLASQERRIELLQAELNDASSSLANWRQWVELESRLRPAVHSYERLRQLNERCQEITRPIGELRVRLAGELAILDHAPHDLIEGLEYHPLLAQAVDDARRKLEDVTGRREQLQQELEQLRQSLDREFANHRGRPELAHQVEELRLLREQIASQQSRVRELTRQTHQDAESSAATRHSPAAPSEHETLDRAGSDRSAWQALGPESARQLADARERVAAFCREHAEYVAAQAAAHETTEWLAEQKSRIARLESDHRELAAVRERGRAEITLLATEARQAASAAQARRGELQAARQNLEHRFVDFLGAPDQLPSLWDELHAIEASQREVRRELDVTWEEQRRIARGRYWRRGLTLVGGGVLLTGLIVSRGAIDWLLSAVTAGLTGSLQWIYPRRIAQAAEAKRRQADGEQQRLQLGRRRDELVTQIGPQFVVPPEREAEWRRLWPTYRRELERLDMEARSLSDDDEVAAWTKAAGDAEKRLSRYDAESQDLLEESLRELARARAEHERRSDEANRLTDRLIAHTERYFGVAGAGWDSAPAASLPPWWEPVLRVAAADRCRPACVVDLVAWCQSLDEQRWSHLADACRVADQPGSQREGSEFGAEGAATPVVQAPPATDDGPLEDPNEAADADNTLRSLEEQADRLEQAITPFTVETDPVWLHQRSQACEAVEQEIAERELDLECSDDPTLIERELELATVQLAEATEVLAPLLDRFDHDPQRVLAALSERDELTARLRELEAQADQVRADCGYASLEELAHEAGKAEGLVATIRASSQELLERANELWQAVDALPGLPAQRVAELEARVAERQAELSASDRERAELAATIRQQEVNPAYDVNAVRAELESLRAERAELERQRDQIAAEFQEASRLMQELQRVERQALEGRITAYFADFSRTAGRHVELDEELRIRVRNEDGRRYSPDQLSHGARDQLCLAVYLATTAGFDLPFLLDDPFVNCDVERLAAIRACWDRLVPDRQLILLSHDPQLASWAPALEMREAA